MIAALVLAAAVTAAKPCSTPEFRQLDYWVGEWAVFARGNKIADSSIQRILGDCVVFESYTALRGYAGKSFSMYDAATKRWEQRYVDNMGAFHEWRGGPTAAGMQFIYKHDGEIDRMTYIKQNADRVEQLIEGSTDGGKTWKVSYDGIYVRKR